MLYFFNPFKYPVNFGGKGMLLISIKQSICIVLIKLHKQAGFGFIIETETVAAVDPVVTDPAVFVAVAVVIALATASEVLLYKFPVKELFAIIPLFIEIILFVFKNNNVKTQFAGTGSSKVKVKK